VANPTKGQDYEREICVELSEWWTYGRRSDIFWRTGGSGARATVRAKSHKKTANQDGDITFTDPLGLPFIKTLTIEVKRGYSTKTAYDCFDRTDTSAIRLWEEFFAQAQRSHENAGSLGWAIISRRDRREGIIFISAGVFRRIREVGGLAKRPCPVMQMGVYVRTKKKGQVFIDFMAMRFEDFICDVNPAHILQIYKEDLTAAAD
jgi:hypothetical protein